VHRYWAAYSQANPTAQESEALQKDEDVEQVQHQVLEN